MQFGLSNGRAGAGQKLQIGQGKAGRGGQGKQFFIFGCSSKNICNMNSSEHFKLEKLNLNLEVSMIKISLLDLGNGEDWKLGIVRKRQHHQRFRSDISDRRDQNQHWKGVEGLSVCLSCKAGCNFLLLSLAAKGKQNTTHSLCNFLLLSLAAKGKKNTTRSLCNFFLLSLAAKGKKVPCVISSSCPWQQKEKKTLPVPCVISSSCPWQQKENSKQGRAGARAGQGRAGRPGQ